MSALGSPAATAKINTSWLPSKLRDAGWINRLNRADLGLLLLCVFGFFVGLNTPPLFDLDEGAFGAATMEMLLRGDFITTYLNGELRFDKPILIYWLQAASVSLFGLNEWGLRFPSAVMASLWSFAIFLFCKPRLGERMAFVAAAMMVCTLGVGVIGRAATADALLNALIALSLLDAYRVFEASQGQSQNNRAALYRAYIWIGLGILTKGPVAVVVPLAAITLFSLWGNQWHSWRKIVLCPLGWALCLSIALPWYVLEYQAQGQLFIDGFFLTHNLSRFSDTMEGHGGSLGYYLIVFPLLILPFTGAFFRTLAQLHPKVDPLDRFLWSWFAFVFVFFSASSTQLPHYLLYGATPIFILTAKHLGQLRSALGVALPLLLLLVVLLLLGPIAEQVATHSDDLYLRTMLSDGAHRFNTGYTIGVLVALGATLIAIGYLRNRLPALLVCLGLIQMLVTTQVLGPTYAELQQAPVKAAAELARTLNAPVVSYAINMPSFSVYYGAPVAKTSRDALTAEQLVYTRIDRLSQLTVTDIVFSEGGIALVRVQPQ